MNIFQIDTCDDMKLIRKDLAHKNYNNIKILRNTNIFQMAFFIIQISAAKSKPDI